MKISPQAKKTADEFLKIAPDFKLGSLPTEMRHPDTIHLAEMSHTDIPSALRLLQQVDHKSLSHILEKKEELEGLCSAISDTFASGGRVFIYGCGATGRLALSLETLWRARAKSPEEKDRVVGFMSGGDLALVHSIENFEDHPEFGARQVQEIGFGSQDLLISCTEGGETPSVIGATEEAAKISRRKPYFLYCNPTKILEDTVERSRRMIRNEGIEKICLYAGPMSLSGSTRMQATTILQIATGWALWKAAGEEFSLSKMLERLQSVDYALLAHFVELESKAYQEGNFFLYQTSQYGITLLTDTTERSPTFSLPGFENTLESAKKVSLAYLSMKGARDSREAWEALLHREPRALEWEVLGGIASMRRLMGFDISLQAKASREDRIGEKKQLIFTIDREESEMKLSLEGVSVSFSVTGLSLLEEHMLLKLLMNAHSLLVMGRLGRFESNVMTWVKPSNNKLIDRSIRYVSYLLEKDVKEKFSYETLCYQLFQEVETLKEGESIVLKTVAAIKQAARTGSSLNSVLLLLFSVFIL